MSGESLAQLRDAVLERHREFTDAPGVCMNGVGHPFPCPEYRLATALSPENVATAHHTLSHHYRGGADDGLARIGCMQFGLEQSSCYRRAAALLGAIPVDTQEGA